MGEFVEGVYESLETAGLQRQLGDLPLEARFEVIDPADAPEVLARHIADVVRRTLDDRDEPARVALVNELIGLLHDEDAAVTDRLRQLIALTRQVGPARRDIIRPVTPLSEAALLTNAPEEPSLGSELRAELASADRVDLLCAFIKWHGLRVIENQLIEFARPGCPPAGDHDDLHGRHGAARPGRTRAPVRCAGADHL